MKIKDVWRHLWYRLSRWGPTNGFRKFSLKRIDFVEVGENCYFGPDCTITPLGGQNPKDNLLILENKVTVSPNVSFLCSMHPEESNLSKIYGETSPIKVKENAWIGADVTILGGVTVGKYSVVGAGSVVTKDVPEYTVVAGVPAEPIKRIDPEVVKGD